MLPTALLCVEDSFAENVEKPDDYQLGRWPVGKCVELGVLEDSANMFVGCSSDDAILPFAI